MEDPLSLRLSPDQQDLVSALDAFDSGYGGTVIRGTPVFRVSGAGGTGKTTIVARWAAHRGEADALFLAPTNAAAVRLARSLRTRLPSAKVSTIHSAIYYPEDMRRQTRERIDKLQADLPAIVDPGVKEGVREELRALRKFLKAGAIAWDSNEVSYRDMLIVVDEASMVSLDVLYDLIDRCGDGTRIIAMGDDRQLKPVGGEAFFHRDVDATLTTNHRTAEGALAQFLQEVHADPKGDRESFGRKVERLADGDSVVVPEGLGDLLDTIKRADIILTHRNIDWLQAAVVRAHLLGSHDDVTAGGKVRAMRTEAVGRGETRQVLVSRNETYEVWTGDDGVQRVYSDAGTRVTVDERYLERLVDIAFLGNAAKATALVREPQTDPNVSGDVEFAPASAATVHAAQGNEWTHVAFIVPAWARYAKHMEAKGVPMAKDLHRLQYTAASRARRRFTYIETYRGTPWSRHWKTIVQEAQEAFTRSRSTGGDGGGRERTSP